jgi:uncharacterized protein (TIGR02996 family)
MTDHHQAFLSAIVANPDDPTPRLIYADWLEERGDPACEAWRWAAEHGCKPRFDRNRDWVWMYSGLPREVFNLLVRNMKEDGFELTVEAAYLRFVRAFLAARRTGWKPNWPDASQGETSPFITNRETKE